MGLHRRRYASSVVTVASEGDEEMAQIYEAYLRAECTDIQAVITHALLCFTWMYKTHLEQYIPLLDSPAHVDMHTWDHILGTRTNGPEAAWHCSPAPRQRAFSCCAPPQQSYTHHRPSTSAPRNTVQFPAHFIDDHRNNTSVGRDAATPVRSNRRLSQGAFPGKNTIKPRCLIPRS